MGSENANEASETQAPAMVLKDLSVAPVFPSLYSKTASGDPCRSSGFYRLDRAWALENKHVFLSTFLVFVHAPPTVPLGRAHGPSGSVRFTGICRICSPLPILVKSGSPLGPPRWSGVHLPVALQSCHVPLWARELMSERVLDTNSLV